MADGTRLALQGVIDVASHALASAEPPDAKRLSAELNGIITFYAGQVPPQPDVQFLLCTDTWLGRETARLVEAWLRGRGCNVITQIVENLRTDRLAPFELALSNYVKSCAETFTDYRQRRYHVVFNLTGGFKGVQGFLQTLAHFYADETIYVFQDSGELLRIPRLPVRLDAEAVVEEHLTTVRRVALGLSTRPSERIAIPVTFLFQLDDDACLSEWGAVVWLETRGAIYRRRLHPPPSQLIRWADGFERSVRQYNLPPDRLIELNKRLDELAAYLEQGRRVNPASLHFHSVGPKVMPPSTHEFYAWSDQGAYRVFCRDLGAYVELDRLAPHPKEKD